MVPSPMPHANVGDILAASYGMSGIVTLHMCHVSIHAAGWETVMRVDQGAHSIIL